MELGEWEELLRQDLSDLRSSQIKTEAKGLSYTQSTTEGYNDILKFMPTPCNSRKFSHSVGFLSDILDTSWLLAQRA